MENEEGLFALFNDNNLPIGFVFPITLESQEDGEQYTVNDEEETRRPHRRLRRL